MHFNRSLASPVFACNRTKRQRENPLVQDLGATLVLIMGTHALVAPVKAIGSWLQKRHSAKLSIVTLEKKIVAENLTGKDAAYLLQLFLTPKYRTQGARSL